MDGFKFDIEGFDTVFRSILELENDVKKANAIKAILRKQSAPALRSIKGKVKDATRNVTKTTGGGVYTYTPGNLSRSMRIKTKGRDYPTAFIGAHVPKKSSADSGYYSSFVQYGTKKKKGGIKNTNDFVKKAGEDTQNQIGNNASEELAKYIKRKARRIGLQAK